MTKVFNPGESRVLDRGHDPSDQVHRFREGLLTLEAGLASDVGLKEPFSYIFECLLDALRATKTCAWYWSRADDSIEYLPAGGGDIFGLGPVGLPRRGADFLAQAHTEDRAPLSRKLNHARKSGRTYELHHRMVDEQGLVHIMRATGRPLMDRNGRHLGDVGTWQNVTAFKLSEDARRLSEERYALAVDGSNDGIYDWVIELDAVYYSPRLKEILGLPQDDDLLSSDRVLSMIHPADRAEYVCAVRRHLKGVTRYFTCECRMVRPDGDIRWIFGRGLALRDRAGRAYRMAGSVSDVTERKETER